MASKFNLDGKVAVVTGGAGLLGAQHAIALAEIGGRVAITDLNVTAAQKVADEINSELQKDSCFGLSMDVTQPASIEAAKNALVSRWGRVDILVNNAAIDPKVKDDKGLLETSRFENFPVDQWDFQLRVGLTGAFLCSQSFGPHFAKNGGGVILNIASDLSVIAPDQRIYRKEGVPEERQPVKPVTYSVIKAGLIGMTLYLATYWAEAGVRCNALSPGGVFNGQPEEFVKKLTNLIPMGRMAHREEYRGAIQFLCSDASSYLNGQNIVMDGGRSVL